MPVHLLFDLGNGDNLLLFPTVLGKIDKVYVGESAGLVSLYGPEEGRPTYRVDLVQIGDMNFTNVNVVEDFHDAEYQSNFIDKLGAHGSVGTGLFVDRKLVFDYQRKELTIISPDAPENEQSACRGQEIPFIPGSEEGVLTLAKTEIGDIKFVWDTGAVPNIILKSRVDREDLAVSDRNSVILNQVAFNGHEFGPLEFKVWDFPVTPPFDGFISHDFFEDHIVCVDFLNDRLLIRK